MASYALLLRSQAGGDSCVHGGCRRGCRGMGRGQGLEPLMLCVEQYAHCALHRTFLEGPGLYVG